MVQLTEALNERDTEVKTKEKVIQQLRANYQDIEQKYHAVGDCVPKLEVHNCIPYGCLFS